ncbi:MAG: hypothetical protein HFE51_07205 [Clostridia bacterium]|jgi:hypothetical protein|nr:hypothetical protein [Clostridia bacterium]
MKKITTYIITAILMLSSVTANAASIPRETTPLNATEEQIQIVENLIGDILDEVQADRLGYALAAGYANTRIRKAVIANQTNGNGYGILSPIAQNAIRYYRDILLRPDYYRQTEEKLKSVLADLIVEVQNGKDYNTAYDEARIKIYKAANASFNPDTDMVGDFCYWNVPPVDSAEFTVARKLLLQAQK